jgi:hypothetical protein
MTKPISYRRSRPPRTISAARTESASRALRIESGCEIVCLTHGQFSLVDALDALLRQTGSAHVSIATWTAAAADTERAEQLLRDDRIISMRWLVDRSFETRQPDYCATLRRLFGDAAIRTTRSHAKFATLRNESWDLAIRTSMNLNHNARLELIEVSDDPALADFLDAQFGEVFARQASGVMDGELPPIRRIAAIQAGILSP